jgi:ABC-type branched-subunit amino acid transport system substrate-binding protein
MLALGIAACAGSARERTIVIGVDLPLTGNDGAEGLMALHGAELAAAAYFMSRRLGPVRLVVRDTSGGRIANPHEDEGSDDPSEPRNGVESLRIFAADRRIIGVVGALRSDVVASEAPVARTLGLPVVSPALVVHAAGWHVRSEPALFAVGFNDVDEARAAALAARLAGFRRVAALEDGGTASSTEAAAFAESFAESGRDVAVFDDDRRAAESAQAVFYKGPVDRPALLVPRDAVDRLLSQSERKRMGHRGYSTPVTAVPYLRIDPKKRLGSARLGTGTLAVAALFRKRYGALPDEAGLTGFDAMWVLLRAFEHATQRGRPDRRGTIDALRTGAIDTLLGAGTFDGTGVLTGNGYVAAVVMCGRAVERYPMRRIGEERYSFLVAALRRRGGCAREAPLK